MKLSDTLLAALGRPEFWVAWYELAADALGNEVAVGNDVAIEVTADHTHLILELDAGDLGIERAGIWSRIGNRLVLHGGDWAALRWDEVEWIGRAIALRGGPPHPGAMFALFGRFAPIYDDDWTPRLIASLGIAGAPPHMIERMVERLDVRSLHSGWSRDEHGWAFSNIEGLLSSSRSPSTVAELDQVPLLRDGEGAGWIERRELRRRTDRFFERLASECLAMIIPAWRTPRMLALADAFAGGDHTAAAVLADALHEAGCTHPELLAALADPPERAAWAVDLIRAAAR